VLLGGVLRFALLGDKTLWLDEAFSLWMARHPLPDLMMWLVRIDHHPPLYYTLLHLWTNWWGDSPAALRSLSALASTLALLPFALAARRLAGGQVATVAALLLALSPFHLRYAQETRMYGVLTLAVALLLWAVTHLLTGDGKQKRWWVILVVAEAAAMLTHNTATVLVPLALNGAILPLWWLRGRNYRLATVAEPHFFTRWLVSQVAALLLWSPWAGAFVRQAQVVDGDFWIAPPDLWTVWLALGSLTFAHLPAWWPARDYMAWLALALVAWGIWQWRRDTQVTWLLLAWWLIPPAIELLASLRRPIFYDRTLIWTTLPLFVLIARGMVLPLHVSGRGRTGWLIVTALPVIILLTVGVWHYFIDFPKERWDKAAQVVADGAAADDLILFHASWAELPFAYYYPLDAPPLTQHGVPADLFSAGALEPPMTEADVGRVRELVAGRAGVWLVYSHWWYADPDGLLPRVLAESFAVRASYEWPGIRVIHYTRP
jgi:uncharacterized membrane protein